MQPQNFAAVYGPIHRRSQRGPRGHTLPQIFRA